MMPRLTALAATTIATLALAPAALAAPLSKTIQFRAFSGNNQVTCGVEIHAPSQPASKVLCSARGIPAPKGPGVGDPGFAQLGLLAKPQTLRLSQDSFVSGSVAKLGRGRLWNQLGVTCHIGLAKVLCFNGDNHGFIIGSNQYVSF